MTATATWVTTMSESVDTSGSIHICPDRSFASVLATLGLRKLVVIEDNLMLGPCGVKYGSHFKKRTDFWKNFPRRFSDMNDAVDLRWAVKEPSRPKAIERLFGSASRRSALILWTTPTLRDRLPYWRLLSAMSELGTDPRRCTLIEPTVRHKRRYVPLGVLDENEIGAAMRAARLLTESEIALGTTLWRAFASGRPDAFLRNLHDAPSQRLGRRRLTESFLAYFPSLATHGRLKLSAIDQVIFDCLSAHLWRSAIDVLGAKSLLRFQSVSLESILFRLLSWTATIPADPVFLLRVEPQKDRGMRGLLFKLTQKGVEIRQRGLSLRHQLPPIHTAGCRPSKGRRWVRIRKRDEWTLQRI